MKMIFLMGFGYFILKREIFKLLKFIGRVFLMAFIGFIMSLGSLIFLGSMKLMK